MKNKELLKRMHTVAIAFKQLEAAKEAISEEFEDCDSWEINMVLYNCKIKDNCLYDSKDEMLANDGIVDGKYFCHQYTGFCEDDYYGTVYYPIDDNGSYLCFYYQC